MRALQGSHRLLPRSAVRYFLRYFQRQNLLISDGTILLQVRTNGGGRSSFLPALLSPTDSRRDRKSTRLNSSHLGISYAVFCLKKKQLHLERRRRPLERARRGAQTLLRFSD